MKIVATKAALKAIYYLFAADRTIGDAENSRFAEIGETLDKERFESYKEEIIAECRAQLAGNGEHYDLAQEGIDAALQCDPKDGDAGLTPRLLVWNLFAAALGDENYHKAEKRMILHVARVIGVEQSVVLEMEQSIRTAASIQKELDWVQACGRSYQEVRPIVDELEKRLTIITEAAKALVEDEVVLDDPFVDEPNAFGKAKQKLDDAVKPFANKAGAVAKETLDQIGQHAKDAADAAQEKLNPLAQQARRQAGAFLGALADKVTPKDEESNNKKEEQ